MIEAIKHIKQCLQDKMYAHAEMYLNEAIAEAEKQEPVAWLITDESINHLQVESIQKLIDRAIHAHMTDIKLRINGQDEWYEADWLKHMTRTSLPQRQPLTLKRLHEHWQVAKVLDMTDAEIDFGDYVLLVRDTEALHGIGEKK